MQSTTKVMSTAMVMRSTAKVRLPTTNLMLLLTLGLEKHLKQKKPLSKNGKKVAVFFLKLILDFFTPLIITDGVALSR